MIVAVAMIASTSTALAVTTKPTPKATAKSTAKTTAKARVKPSPKPSAKAPTKTTKKTVTKNVVKKKPAAKKSTPKKSTVYKRKAVNVSPSPSPKWPPSKALGWVATNSEIYYKIPTEKELEGVLSAEAALALQVKPCTNFACGVVDIASSNGCTWWEIDSTVYGPLSATDSTSVPYGTLGTTAKGTNPKQIVTVLLISTEPLKPKVMVGGINISCHHSPAPDNEKIPSNVYAANTPSPSATPTTNTN